MAQEVIISRKAARELFDFLDNPDLKLPPNIGGPISQLIDALDEAQGASDPDDRKVLITVEPGDL